MIFAESQLSEVDTVSFIHLCLLQRFEKAISPMEVAILVPSDILEGLAHRTS